MNIKKAIYRGFPKYSTIIDQVKESILSILVHTYRITDHNIYITNTIFVPSLKMSSSVPFSDFQIFLQVNQIQQFHPCP